jgi:hypothetical protein
LELSHINVEGAIESKGGSQRRDYLADETVQVGVSGALNVEAATADVVDGLVVKHDSDVSVLEKGVSGKDAVVRLHNSGRDLRGWVSAESELGFLSVVNGETLQEERAQTRAGTTADSVEDKEALETSAVVSKLADAVKGEVDNFLSNGVVTTGVVIGGVFLTGDQLLGVEQLTVGSGADLVNDGGFEIEEHSARDVLAGTSFGEKGVEGIVAATNGLVRGHLAIRLDAVLEAVKLPAGVTDLDTSLSNVNRDDFAHVESKGV